MKNAAKIIAVAALLFPACAPARRAQEPYRARTPDPIIRVAILQDASTVELDGENGWVIQDARTNRQQSYSAGDPVKLKVSAKGLSAGETVFSDAVRVRPASRGERVKANGRRYRGFLVVKRREGKILVINELGLDEYLRGILPKEVSPSWAKESLRAQAVVSRTFALSHISRHSAEGFNLCSAVHCQVYGGYESEHPQTNDAVEDTQGEAVLYGDDLANTVFFSNCGGRTEDPRNAWKTQVATPYLKSVRCGYCKGQAHYAWSEEFDNDALARALKAHGVEEPIKDISISRTNKSGRALFLNIRHAGGSLNIKASEFRTAVGANRIRSTLFSKIKRTRNGFHFKGKGWGHGVGMCQEGAKRLAEKGMSHKKIIRFYYPGTRVRDFML